MCVKNFLEFLEFSIEMEKQEKEYTKLKLAACLRKIIKKNKITEQNNKKGGIEDLSLVDTMRQLGYSSGLSYTIIQTASAGKRDINFTTLLTIIDSLDMKFSDFAILYEKITENEIRATEAEIEAAKRKSSKKKLWDNTTLSKVAEGKPSPKKTPSRKSSKINNSRKKKK